MRKVIFLIALLMCFATTKGQVFVETFDSNSLEWTECAFKTSTGTAIIDGGVMTITSKGVKEALSAILSATSGVATQVGQTTFFETHCYAPIDVKKPFKIKAMATTLKLVGDREAGMVFNYKDGGNFYCISFTDEYIQFERYVDNCLVGTICQGIKWTRDAKAKSTLNEWLLESDGDTISFSLDGVPMLKVRYMPIEFTGFGFYSIGDNKTIIDKVEFYQ